MSGPVTRSEVRAVEVRLSAGLTDFMRQTARPGLINMAAGIPSDDALPVDDLREAVGVAMRDRAIGALGYHAPEGDIGLREAIAERLRGRGVRVGAEGVVITTGCSQGLAIMISLMVRAGDVVACERPAYYALLELISRAGGLALQIPSGLDSGPDPDAVEECLARWRPKCLVVCSSLSNPSGATVPAGARARIVESCRRHGARLVEDEIYADLRDDGGGEPMLALDDGSTVSLVSSFSKTVAPGLRIGYAVPGAVFEPFVRRKCIEDIHSSSIAEATVAEFLRRGRLDPHLARLREFYAARRRLAREAVLRAFPHGTEVSSPMGGFVLWARLPSGVDLDAVQMGAMEQGVSFCHGGVFFAERPERPCVRLNCARASEADLRRGIGILGELLARK